MLLQYSLCRCNRKLNLTFFTACLISFLLSFDKKTFCYLAILCGVNFCFYRKFVWKKQGKIEEAMTGTCLISQRYLFKDLNLLMKNSQTSWSSQANLKRWIDDSKFTLPIYYLNWFEEVYMCVLVKYFSIWWTKM